MDTPQAMDGRYDSDYFLRGKETGKSLYENYRWLPNLTVPMAETITDFCGIELEDVIMDFGCARGYLVRALVSLGYDAYGVDVSEWALQNADPQVLGRLSHQWPPAGHVDWIIAKDVLEHIAIHRITNLLKEMAEVATKGIFAVVPLAKGVGQRYAVEEYEADVTHSLRWPLDLWTREFIDVLGPEWEVSVRYRIHGVKDNYAEWPKGNGFITCKRIT